MPDSPQECRRQALACVRLAQTSVSAKDREKYANLATTWLSLAGDLRLSTPLKAWMKQPAIPVDQPPVTALP
jgi:hypothetical protein